jgi:hypothetical protein
MWRQIKWILSLTCGRVGVDRRLHRSRRKQAVFERFEDRNLLSGLPFGAMPDDTAEYMLGDIYVSVVLMESDSSLAPHDANKEDWTPAPHTGYTQQPSIMAGYWLLDTAWASQVNAPSSLEMVGWQDNDGDGIFDVLDVPLTLEGTGYYDATEGLYHFLGSSAVGTLPNLNSSGLQNDITLNEISRVEYRVAGGDWQTAATYHTPQAALDLQIRVAEAGVQTIEIRAVDDATGVTSVVFQGDTGQPAAVTNPGINGFVWNDVDGDGEFDNLEDGVSGWTVRLVDAAGRLLSLGGSVEPDDYALGTLLSQVQATSQLAVTVSAANNDLGSEVAVAASAMASTGSLVFASRSSDAWTTSWSASGSQLRMDFSVPLSYVQLDAIGTGNRSYGRLEVYDAAGELLSRYTTGALGSGQRESMQLLRPTTDIAYAIARGHMSSAVELDNLHYGPEATAVTGAQGAYWLPSLPMGSYHVQALSPSGGLVTPSSQLVIAADDAAVEHFDFATQAAIAAWRNPANPMADAYFFSVGAGCGDEIARRRVSTIQRRQQGTLIPDLLEDTGPIPVPVAS